MAVQKKDEGKESRGPGRPRIRRRMGICGPLRCYAPQCQTSEPTGTVTLLPDEIEILRLIDLEGLEQEEAANQIGVSRRTVWKDLKNARAKVADALVNGKVIEISGCSRRLGGECPRSDTAFCPKIAGACPKMRAKNQDLV